MSGSHPPPPSPEAIVSWFDAHPRGEWAIAYRGRLAGRAGLRLHYGFDGWEDPREVETESYSPGLAVAWIGELDSHVAVDFALRHGDEWDNNTGADFRLWTRFTPIDSHLHAAAEGLDRLGLAALGVGLSSAGILGGVLSWQDNDAVDRMVGADPRFRRLIWVNPRRTDPRDVADRLAHAHVGLKLHPAVDDFPADSTLLDPYMEHAAAAGVPVAVHSGPGNADPHRIARLAARFPTVPVILYHTFLGIPWGRRRAAHHARHQPNMVLETSWCGSREVERLVSDLGPERVMFGSDASVDGPHHFVNRNVEGRESYKEVMLRITQSIGLEAAAQVLRENARRLFRLDM